MVGFETAGHVDSPAKHFKSSPVMNEQGQMGHSFLQASAA
jgi:hypothetical protein